MFRLVTWSGGGPHVESMKDRFYNDVRRQRRIGAPAEQSGDTRETDGTREPSDGLRVLVAE